MFGENKTKYELAEELLETPGKLLEFLSDQHDEKLGGYSYLKQIGFTLAGATYLAEFDEEDDLIHVTVVGSDGIRRVLTDDEATALVREVAARLKD